MAVAVMKVNMLMLDETAEPTRIAFYVEDTISDAAEWIAMFLGVGPYVGVRDAIIGVTDLGHQKSQATNLIESPSDGVPSVATAQREAVLRLFVQDTVTGKKYRIGIPGYKPSLRTAGTDKASFTAGALATLKTKIELSALSEDGNPLVVLSGEFTGRNN